MDENEKKEPESKRGTLLCAVCNKPLSNEHKIVCYTFVCKNPHCADNVIQAFTHALGCA